MLHISPREIPVGLWICGGYRPQHILDYHYMYNGNIGLKIHRKAQDTRSVTDQKLVFSDQDTDFGLDFTSGYFLNVHFVNLILPFSFFREDAILIKKLVF
jgi:hypothetical protein